MNKLATLGLVMVCLAAVACTPAERTPGEDSALGGKADCATCSKLTTSDRIRQAAERENRRWRDRNIASGTAWMVSGRLDDASEDGLTAAAPELLADFYNDDRGGTTNGAAEVGSADVVDLEDEFALEELADRVATEGFAYAPENTEDRTYLRWSIQHTVDWLGDEGSEILSVTASDKYKNDDDEDANVSVTLVANPETRKYVAVYVREGSF